MSYFIFSPVWKISNHKCLPSKITFTVLNFLLDPPCLFLMRNQGLISPLMKMRPCQFVRRLGNTSLVAPYMFIWSAQESTSYSLGPYQMLTCCAFLWAWDIWGHGFERLHVTGPRIAENSKYPKITIKVQRYGKNTALFACHDSWNHGY